MARNRGSGANVSYIVVDNDIHSSGRPTIKGTRITVDDILGYVTAGWSVEKIARQLNIPKAAVLESLAFASRIVKEVGVIA